MVCGKGRCVRDKRRSRWPPDGPTLLSPNPLPSCLLLLTSSSFSALTCCLSPPVLSPSGLKAPANLPTSCLFQVPSCIQLPGVGGWRAWSLNRASFFDQLHPLLVQLTWVSHSPHLPTLCHRWVVETCEVTLTSHTHLLQLVFLTPWGNLQNS